MQPEGRGFDPPRLHSSNFMYIKKVYSFENRTKRQSILEEMYKRLKHKVQTTIDSLETAKQASLKAIQKQEEIWVSERLKYSIPIKEIDTFVDSLNNDIKSFESELSTLQSYGGPSPDGGRKKELIKAKIEVTIDIKERISRIIPKRTLEE